jgi:hypothetical protein
MIKSLKGMEIRNLKNVFDRNYYKRRSDAIENCKFMCYSDIFCQYWQYNSKEGCLVEHPSMNTVPYPLTRNDVRADSEFARNVLDGEYILHRCPEHDGEFTSEDENAKFSMVPWEWNWFTMHWPWDEGGWPWWGWLLFVLGCSCCCVCFLLFFGVLGLGKAALTVGRTAASKVKGRSNSEKSEDYSSSSSDSDSTVSSSSYRQKKKLLR